MPEYVKNFANKESAWAILEKQMNFDSCMFTPCGDYESFSVNNYEVRIVMFVCLFVVLSRITLVFVAVVGFVAFVVVH